jgi:hypothetical protein
VDSFTPFFCLETRSDIRALFGEVSIDAVSMTPPELAGFLVFNKELNSII